MKLRRSMLLLLVFADLALLPLLASAQSPSDSKDSSGNAAITASEQIDLTYVRPTQKTKISNYALAAFGPRTAVISAITAGIDQANNTPPEWNQGAEGYAKRFGSSYGILAAGSTTLCAVGSLQ